MPGADVRQLADDLDVEALDGGAVEDGSRGPAHPLADLGEGHRRRCGFDRCAARQGDDEGPEDNVFHGMRRHGRPGSIRIEKVTTRRYMRVGTSIPSKPRSSSILSWYSLTIAVRARRIAVSASWATR